MTVQVVFSRTLVAGSPGPLTISGDETVSTAGYYIEPDGIIEPDFDRMTTFADSQPDSGGGTVLADVPAIGTFGLVVTTTAVDGGTLKAQKRALEATLAQLTYTAALTIVGSPDTYTCLPAKVTWGTVSRWMVDGLMATGVITVPVQPL